MSRILQSFRAWWAQFGDRSTPRSVFSHTPIPFHEQRTNLTDGEAQYLALVEAFEESWLYDITGMFRGILPDYRSAMQVAQDSVRALLVRGFAELYHDGMDKTPPTPLSREETLAVLNSEDPWQWREDETCFVMIVLTDEGMKLLKRGGYEGVSNRRAREIIGLR